MLSRALNTKSRKSLKVEDDSNSSRSVSIYEYEDCIFGFMDIDVPLIFCDDRDHHLHRDGDHDHRGCRGRRSGSHLTLREVLRGSVGVIGEGRSGMTEKVVMGRERLCAVKRFKKVTVKRGEFGRCIQRLAQVSRECQYLVPITAYLYAKRIKFVVCDYYPMGTLADLLAGARDLGHTALNWTKRLAIILDIAQAIAFIHSLSPSQDKRLHLNIHGNIRSSNVMINIDFTAHLSDYGLAQLTERMEVDTGQRKSPPLEPETTYSDTLCRKSDIHNFGVIILDMLGGPKGLGPRSTLVKRKEEIKDGEYGFFEFSFDGKERKQACRVLDLALVCTNPLPEARPSIEQILFNLGNISSNRYKFVP